MTFADQLLARTRLTPAGEHVVLGRRAYIRLLAKHFSGRSLWQVTGFDFTGPTPFIVSLYTGEDPEHACAAYNNVYGND